MRSSEGGFVLIVTLVIMLLVIVLGLAAVSTTSIELQIAGSDRVGSIAFYTAESARSWVQAKPDLYGKTNTINGVPLKFPNDLDATEKEPLATGQEFNGQVEYIREEEAPPEFGYSAGEYKAHYYQMQCTGYGPDNAESKVKAEFFRIGK